MNTRYGPSRTRSAPRCRSETTSTVRLAAHVAGHHLRIPREVPEGEKLWQGATQVLLHLSDEPGKGAQTYLGKSLPMLDGPTTISNSFWVIDNARTFRANCRTSAQTAKRPTN